MWKESEVSNRKMFSFFFVKFLFLSTCGYLFVSSSTSEKITQLEKVRFIKGNKLKLTELFYMTH